MIHFHPDQPFYELKQGPIDLRKRILIQLPNHENPKTHSDLIIKFRLTVNYKYQHLLLCHPFSHIVMKVATGSIYKCKTSQKNYKFIRKLAHEYLPTLRLFITEFVNNHNYIGKFLQQEALSKSIQFYRRGFFCSSGFSYCICDLESFWGFRKRY